MSDSFKITKTDLNQNPPNSLFEFKDTSELPALDRIIGQERAIEAIDFGLNMKGAGYNIFVTGLEGTGKSTIIRKLLTDHATAEKTSSDLCLVNNFDDAYCPEVIEMPAGTAAHFSLNMARFVDVLKHKIPRFFESESFLEEQNRIQKECTSRQKKRFDDIRLKARSLNLVIIRNEDEYRILPAFEDGKPMPEDRFSELDITEQQKIDQRIDRLEEELENVLVEIDKIGEEMKALLRKVVASRTDQLISEQIDPVRYDLRNCRPIGRYLKRMKEDMIENIAVFLGGQRQAKEPEKHEFEAMTASLLRRYQVNVLVDRRREKGAPVVFEPNPTFQNLFGKIEKKPVMGSVQTDFTMVQAGTLLKANKGYLVLEIEPLLANPPVWESLKRTLRDSLLRIEDMPDQADYGMPSLKPAPIPLNVTVVLMGRYEPFRMLQSRDPKFNKIFKVRADFDSEADLTDENALLYARFVSRVCEQERLLNFTPDGVWAVIEFGSRLVADRTKLSLRFGRILGLLQEADYWARRDQAAVITREYVLKAVHQQRFRHNLYEEKAWNEFLDQSVLLDIEGTVVGQVNALAVYDMGEIAFGRPTRITAESYMGKPGIINVENESDLSGQTHDKGMMIISGYLGRMFAQNYPLSVSISITFEQSYDGIDGDSASSTELYAVLSSLSGLPIRQEIAVTGSVNQKGEIQAIGGVNEKIEGFFDICIKKGFTGTQGVMIPSSNVKNLVLRPDVSKAVGSGTFHLYRVNTIEQGIELLTGVKAGQPDSDFNYPEETVFGQVQKKLRRYHELSIRYGK